MYALYLIINFFCPKIWRIVCNGFFCQQLQKAEFKTLVAKRSLQPFIVIADELVKLAIVRLLNIYYLSVYRNKRKLLNDISFAIIDDIIISCTPLQLWIMPEIWQHP